MENTLTGWFCHQLMDRSPYWGLYQSPLCYRCFGIHWGLLLGYCYLIATGGIKRSPTPLIPTLFAALFLLPFQIDGVGCAFKVWDSPGWFRTLTGGLAGVAVPLMISLLSLQSTSAKPNAPLFKRHYQLLVLLLFSIAPVVLVSVNLPAHLAPLLIYPTIVGTYACILHFALNIMALVRREMRRKPVSKLSDTP